MADRELQEAIRAVGGVTELARRIGISQPSVSNWTRIPAERVLEVESANAVLLKQIGQLHGDEPPLGAAHRELAEAAKNADAADLEREYFDLFIGVGRGELLPYASYYLTGFLHERPLARLRQDWRASASRALTALPSRRIMPASCAKSWRDSPAANYPRRRVRAGDLRETHGALDRALLCRS